MMLYEEIDAGRVKKLTLDKIHDFCMKPEPTGLKKKRLIIAASVSAAVIVGTVGAAQLFDWKYMVNGETQHGSFGEGVNMGEGYANMAPGDPDEKYEDAEEIDFPSPATRAESGQLRLFSAWNDDKTWRTSADDFGANFSSDLNEIRGLLENAEVKISLPGIITDDFTVRDGSCIQFYAKEDQIAASELLYSSFNDMSGEMLFQLPEGSDKYVSSADIHFTDPSGKDFEFGSFLARSSAQAYGGSGSAVIEKLDIRGFSEAVYVYDYGMANLYCWKEIEPVEAADKREFGKEHLPQGYSEDDFGISSAATYGWQSYSLSSEEMSKGELIEIMETVNQ